MNIVGSATTEVIRRSNSGTLTYADGHRFKPSVGSTIESIAALINNLNNDDNTEANQEFNRIQHDVTRMIKVVTSRQLDLFADLTSVIDSFKRGQMTPEQLEQMIRAEQERSEAILHMAASIGSQLQELFCMIDVVIDHMESGSPLPADIYGDSVRSQMNLVFEAVDGMQRIINTAPADLHQTLGQVEKDMANASEEVERVKKSGSRPESREILERRNAASSAKVADGTATSSKSVRTFSPTMAGATSVGPSLGGGAGFSRSNSMATKGSQPIRQGSAGLQKVNFKPPTFDAMSQTDISAFQSEERSPSRDGTTTDPVFNRENMSSPSRLEAGSHHHGYAHHTNDQSRSHVHSHATDGAHGEGHPGRHRTAGHHHHGHGGGDNPAHSVVNSEGGKVGAVLRQGENSSMMDDSAAPSLANSALNSPRTTKVKRDSKAGAKSTKISLDLGSADASSEPLELQLKVQLLEAKIKELEQSLATARSESSARSDRPGGVSSKLSVKMAAKRLMQLSGKAKGESGTTMNDSGDASGGVAGDGEISNETKTDGLLVASGDDSGGLKPEAVPNLVLGGGGFKELAAHTSHPHYHPGATVTQKRAPHPLARATTSRIREAPSTLYHGPAASMHMNGGAGGAGVHAAGVGSNVGGAVSMTGRLVPVQENGFNQGVSPFHGMQSHLHDSQLQPMDDLMDANTFLIHQAHVHQVIHTHQHVPAHEVGYLPADIPFASRHGHHHSVELEAPQPLPHAAARSSRVMPSMKKITLKDAIFKATGKKPSHGMDLGDVALTAAAKARQLHIEQAATTASGAPMIPLAAQQFYSPDPLPSIISVPSQHPMPLTKAISMSRIVPKMSQETSTDDLEAYIRSQGTRSGEPLLVHPMSAAMAGLAAVNTEIAAAEKAGASRAQVIQMMSLRKGFSATGFAPPSNSAPNITTIPEDARKTPPIIAQEARGSSSSASSATSTVIDLREVSGLIPAKPLKTIDDDRDNVSPLTVDDSIGDTHGHSESSSVAPVPSSSASSSSTSQGTAMLHVSPQIMQSIAINSRPPLVPGFEPALETTAVRFADGATSRPEVKLGGKPASPSDPSLGQVTVSVEQAISAAAISQKVRLETFAAAVAARDTTGQGNSDTIPVDDRSVLEYYSNVLAPVADDQIDTMLSSMNESSAPKSAGGIAPDSEPRGANLLSKMHSTYSSSRSAMFDGMRDSNTTSPAPLQSILSTRAFAPQQRAHTTAQKSFADEFKAKLVRSANPLRAIYDEYGSCLPDYFKSRLLMAIPHIETEDEQMPNTARARENKQPSTGNEIPADLEKQINAVLQEQRQSVAPQQAGKFFGELLPLIANVLEKATLGLSGIRHCENTLVTILSLTLSDERTKELAQKSVASLFRKLGALEGLKVFVDVQLGEYRSIFDGINALSANTFPTLMKSCAEFKDCFAAFTACQSAIVEVNSRVAAVKEKVIAASLNNAPSATPAVGASVSQTAHDQQHQQLTVSLANSKQTPSKIGPTTSTKLAESGSASGQASVEVKSLTRARDDALARLHEAEIHADELEYELMKEREIKDRTPGALAFYATFADPAAIITFTSLFQVLGTLKAFVNCEEHLEFPILRNRLKQCLSQLPIVERFITRYDGLHKQWTSQRMSTFADRGLTGNSADSTFTCPICDCDSRLGKPLTIAPSPQRLGMSPQKVLKSTEKMAKSGTMQSRAASRNGRVNPIDPLPQPPRSANIQMHPDLLAPGTPKGGGSLSSSISLPAITNSPGDALKLRRGNVPVVVPGQPRAGVLQITDSASPGYRVPPLTDTLSILSPEKNS